MENFCKTYLGLGGELAGLAKWFLIAALAAAVVAVAIEVMNSYRAPAAPRLAPAPAPTAIKDLAEALKSLITALSSAPVWLALFGAGVLLFWVPGNAVGVCGQATDRASDDANRAGTKGTGSNQVPANPAPGNTQDHR